MLDALRFASRTERLLRMYSRPVAFHVLGLDRRGALCPVRIGRHQIRIERGGITLCASAP